MFKIISKGHRTQTHCDGSEHILLTLPQHEHSGEPIHVEALPCDCEKSNVVDFPRDAA